MEYRCETERYNYGIGMKQWGAPWMHSPNQAWSQGPQGPCNPVCHAVFLWYRIYGRGYGRTAVIDPSIVPSVFGRQRLTQSP